jgi:hypothetical protein
LFLSKRIATINDQKNNSVVEIGFVLSHPRRRFWLLPVVYGRWTLWKLGLRIERENVLYLRTDSAQSVASFGGTASVISHRLHRVQNGLRGMFCKTQNLLRFFHCAVLHHAYVQLVILPRQQDYQVLQKFSHASEVRRFNAR